MDDCQEPIVTEARRLQAQRERTYRERALRMYPPICGHCGREFSGKRLRELTVHHRDHNHENNPSDGSNWELLCLYCHDNEHARLVDAEGYADAGGAEGSASGGEDDGHQPFADLRALLQNKERDQ